MRNTQPSDASQVLAVEAGTESRDSVLRLLIAQRQPRSTSPLVRGHWTYVALSDDNRRSVADLAVPGTARVTPRGAFVKTRSAREVEFRRLTRVERQAALRRVGGFVELRC